MFLMCVEHAVLLLGLAGSSHDCMMVVKGLGHAIQMSGCGQDDKDMEDLVGAAPNIKTAGISAFREPDLVFALDIGRKE